MNARLNIFIIVVFLLFGTSLCQAQETKTEGYLVPMCVYEGDTIPYIKIPMNKSQITIPAVTDTFNECFVPY